MSQHATTQMYAVYLSDLSRPADVFVAGRATKDGARRLVAELNAAELAKHGGNDRDADGRPVPVYYLVRTTET